MTKAVWQSDPAGIIFSLLRWNQSQAYLVNPEWGFFLLLNFFENMGLFLSLPDSDCSCHPFATPCEL